MMDSKDDRTLWCGNLNPKVTEEILHELFLQAGPLLRVNIPKDKATGVQKSFAFIEFKHDVSVPYTIRLMSGLNLYGRPLKMEARPGSIHRQGADQNPNAQFNKMVHTQRESTSREWRNNRGDGNALPLQQQQPGVQHGYGRQNPNIPQLTGAAGDDRTQQMNLFDLTRQKMIHDLQSRMQIHAARQQQQQQHMMQLQNQQFGFGQAQSLQAGGQAPFSTMSSQQIHHLATMNQNEHMHGSQWERNAVHSHRNSRDNRQNYRGDRPSPYSRDHNSGGRNKRW